MYLIDRELRARLEEFGFDSEFPEHPFDPDVQIGPCSVDLRLGAVYWKQRTIPFRSQTIDIERTHLMELRPRRGWRRVELHSDEKLRLRPGEMVLARIAENFRMPPDCAGLIEGRSSYARLGLSVHATGSFINPGWRGHMPLTLINHGSATLRIPAGTPLCQLLVTPLADHPEADYEQRGDRKYLNDQGGPSYWWRDQLIRRIHEHFSSARIDQRVLSELDELLANTSDDYLYFRLDHFLEAARRTFSNASDLLEDFSKRERRAARLYRLLTIGMDWSWTIVATVVAAIWITNVTLVWKVGVTTLAVPALVLLYLGRTRPDREFLTPDRLQQLEMRRDRSRPDP